MRVLVFGASSAQGFWDSEGGWVDRLKRHYDKKQMQNYEVDQPRIMNLGVSGDAADQVINRFDPETQARQSSSGTAFIIQIGSNNAAEQNGQPISSPESYAIDLETIIMKAKGYSGRILVVGFPAVNERLTNPVAWAPMFFKNERIFLFENTAKAVSQKVGVPFVPIFEKFKSMTDVGTDLNAHDGLHPNDSGHRLIFELVQPQLDQLLQSVS
jgi:lysophospholipase L1-like esterase